MNLERIVAREFCHIIGEDPERQISKTNRAPLWESRLTDARILIDLIKKHTPTTTKED